MKNILLVLRNYRREIHEAVFDYAQTRGWLLEYFPKAPGRWRGDGILTDYLSDKELAQVRGKSRIPVVMRQYSEAERVGAVFGDMDAIAEMAVEYFQNRGIRTVAGIDRFVWKFDPCRRFIDHAKRQGFKAEHFCWGESRDEENYAGAVMTLRKYLRQLSKPCGIFLGGMHCANMVYRACAMEKIQIPKDLAILTNDDDPLVCESYEPRLSGIAGEINHIGLEMARMLDRMMADPDLKPKAMFIAPQKVITRQSTDILAVPHPATAKAIHYIFESYGKLIGVEDVSRHAGLSLNALQFNFRRYVGKAPSEFLRQIRMNRARELLEESEATLQQIARQTGYSSAMALYIAFKREFKQTPGAYRRESRADPSRKREAHIHEMPH
ncbi:MAG TPA: helix-turn-helix domain-containing protein [Chthoniobacteraceae bacterium]|jgi:LacI family transcriptional regulator|nr:helix-turn-helix domain-containing protein [Chthoniobacteraceae bacterium]